MPSHIFLFLNICNHVSSPMAEINTCRCSSNISTPQYRDIDGQHGRTPAQMSDPVSIGSKGVSCFRWTVCMLVEFHGEHKTVIKLTLIWPPTVLGILDLRLRIWGVLSYLKQWCLSACTYPAYQITSRIDFGTTTA